jgi:hypothetical protein
MPEIVFQQVFTGLMQISGTKYQSAIVKVTPIPTNTTLIANQRGNFIFTNRILRRIFLLAGIVLLVWVLYLLKPVVIPFIGAFFQISGTKYQSAIVKVTPIPTNTTLIANQRGNFILYCIAGMGVVLTQACSHSFYRCFFPGLFIQSTC